MKTLDEVIEALKVCGEDEPLKCPYFDSEEWHCCDWCGDKKTHRMEMLNDALQWLKGYRGHIELDKLRDKLDAENDLLDWDELKTMVGKPVWIEEDGSKRWVIMQGTETTKDGVVYANVSNYLYEKKYYGTDWKAYWKERG